MIRVALRIALASAVLTPATVLAQADEPARGAEAGSTIVVTGEQPTHSEVTRQAREITQSTALLHAPLPRFEGDRLCPGVIGLKPDFASLAIDRLRANAERFGLWMTEDDGTCQPNFIVAFVDDGQDVLRNIHKRWYWLFTDMPRHERIALLADEGPVHVWTTMRSRTAGGMNLPTDPYGRQVKAMSSGGVARAALPVREDIVGVLVLFDRDDVGGMTLTQLADYATMRGLARTRPVDGDGHVLDTILALFDPDATPPTELTSFDTAYLGSLYAGVANLPGLTKVLNVNTQLRRQARAETTCGARRGPRQMRARAAEACGATDPLPEAGGGTGQAGE